MASAEDIASSGSDDKARVRRTQHCTVPEEPEGAAGVKGGGESQSS